ncbi:MAG: acyl-CoA/acyl-ACP dehydrogenase, partial [Clostridia bacterium]|nr:acyl-CoA/acyl-ACP dehydrogenase [Clostridia bacterium]
MPFSGFELPGELALLQQVVRRFVQEEIVPVERSLDPDAPCIPDERLAPLQEKARQAGLWYLPVPKEFGGGGLSTFALAVVMEEASKHTYSLPEAGGGAFGHDLPVPLFKGNDEQKQRYVSPSVRHGWRWFTAITEPSGGSDPARAIQTRAERRNGRWVLNGRKMFATGADRARFGVVYARTDPERGRGGISAFIVPTGIPGMEVR